MFSSIALLGWYFDTRANSSLEFFIQDIKRVSKQMARTQGAKSDGIEGAEHYADVSSFIQSQVLLLCTDQ